MIDGSVIAAIAVVTLGGIVSGLAGFGSALVMVPPLLLIYDPPTVVTVSLALTLLTGWIVLFDTWREAERTTVLALLPGALVGLFIGTKLLQAIDSNYIKLLASFVVIVFTLVVVRGWTPSAVDTAAAPVFAGIASGILNGATGMAGPPVVLLLTARGFGIQPFRATTVLYFCIIDAVGLIVLIQQGVTGWSELGIAAVLLPAALAGSFAGRSLVRRVSVSGFRRITLGLLVLTGTVGIINALAALS